MDRSKHDFSYSDSVHAFHGAENLEAEATGCGIERADSWPIGVGCLPIIE